MTLPRDIDSLLRDWPFQPGVVARLIEAADGREVLQMRVEMGLVQMETEFRPDGDHPQGKRTYLEYIRGVAEGGGRAFTLSDEQCAEIDREFLQYYHRRICWLALREFSRAVVDANHTLDLMDFVRQHSPNEQWTVSHEQYRPFVLFHRTQAAALAEVEHSGPAAAIEQVRNGLRLIREVFRTVDAAEQYDDDELVRQLIELEDWIRKNYQMGQTLEEQLAEAVAREEYELAARLRDQISRRPEGQSSAESVPGAAEE
jgi:hypothetical protein